MQDIVFRVPSVRTHYTVSSTGNVVHMDEPSSSQFIFRTQTGYKGKIPKTKPLPIHDYSFNVQRISAQQITGEYHYSNGSSEYGFGPILNVTPGGATYSAVDVSDLYNKALDRLNDNVRGGLDVSIDLAEAHKTAKMLKVKDQVLNYTKTFVGRFGPIKAAGDLWLAYTYGVKPLLSTLYGCADENIRVVINKTESFKGRASKKVRPASVSINTIWGPVNFPLTQGYVKYSCTVGVNINPKQFDLARWSSLNPLSIAWELMPYSFVVDWFYNVGGYLRQMETSLLYATRFNSGYRTDLSVSCGIVGEIRDVLVGADNHVAYHMAKVEHVNINRTTLQTYPRPTLPTLGANLGSSRLLSASALLAQALKGR